MTGESLLSWAALLPLAAAMLLTWVGTTYFWVRLGGVPARISLAIAPAVTACVIWLVSLFAQQVGLFWSGARVLPLLALIGLLGMGFYGLRVRAKGPLATRIPPDRDHLPLKLMGAPKWMFIASCVVGWVLAMLPSLLVSPANNPVQQWDSSFHMNGIWGITQLGVAAPGEGLEHNYGGIRSSAYPIGWHAFTSLFATGPTAVQTANASTLAIMALWVLGVGILIQVLYPARIASVAAPVIAGLLPSMPADALTMYSQWPNALSVAYLPGVAALAVLLGRSLVKRLTNHPTRARASTFASFIVVLLLAVYGGIQSHPVFAFNMLILLIPAVIAGGIALIRHSLAVRRWFPGILVAPAAVLGVTVVTLVMLTPEVTSTRNYPRNGVDLPTAIGQFLAPTPPFPSSFGLASWSTILSILTVLAALRIYLARRSPSPRWQWPGVRLPLAWPVWSHVLFLVLVFFAYGPNWAIREWIVGPWFNDGRRIMEPMSITLAILAALGFEWLVLWCLRWWNNSLLAPPRSQRVVGSLAVGTIIFGLSVGGALDGRIQAAAYVLDPDRLGKPGMATQGVLDMMRTLPEVLPEDAVVLGDPQAGAVYAQMIGQRWVFFPQLSFLNADEELEQLMVQHFKDIHEDPAVCAGIRAAGITHYFENADGDYYGRTRSDRAPGLYNVDTSTGFELVAEGDEARLYAITACDQ